MQEKATQKATIYCVGGNLIPYTIKRSRAKVFAVFVNRECFTTENFHDRGQTAKVSPSNVLSGFVV